MDGAWFNIGLGLLTYCIFFLSQPACYVSSIDSGHRSHIACNQYRMLTHGRWFLCRRSGTPQLLISMVRCFVECPLSLVLSGMLCFPCNSYGHFDRQVQAPQRRSLSSGSLQNLMRTLQGSQLSFADALVRHPLVIVQITPHMRGAPRPHGPRRHGLGQTEDRRLVGHGLADQHRNAPSWTSRKASGLSSTR